jgi:hypothetical protein
MKCVVDNETISKYFENVLGADPPELSEEVLNSSIELIKCGSPRMQNIT